MIKKHPTRGSKITGGFRTRLRPTHDGTDYRARTGAPIYAAHDGVVRRGTGHATAGNWIHIDGDHSTTTGYLHLSKFEAANGQHVKAGQLIGRAGSTGRSTAAHLHFFVRLSGKYVNPVTWLGTPSGANDDGVNYQSGRDKRTLALQKGMRKLFPAYRWRVKVKRGQLITADGYDGPQTEAWVKEFQRRERLPQTGDYGWGSPTAWRLKGYGIELPYPEKY